MKGSHQILLALLFVVMLLSNGCKPKDCKKDGSCAEEYYRTRIGGLKNYLYALNGSYWIYKNTKTAELDTQTCISFYYDSIKVRGTLNYSKFKVIEYDRIGRTIYSSYYKTSVVDYTLDYSPDSRSFNNGVIILTRKIYGVGTADPLIYPFQNGIVTGNGSSVTEFKGLDSTLIIQGKTYYSVAKFDIDVDHTWDDFSHSGGIYYWAKDVGIVKHTHKDGNYSWELIDYHIIK